MPKIAIAKKITRNQALSYDRTVPNGLGVTAISAVNGRGSYERFAKNRYRQTRAILRNAESSDLSTNGDGMFYYKSKKAKPNKGMSRKQKAKCAPLVSKAVAEAKKALEKVAAKSKPKPKGPKRKMSPAQKAALKKGQAIMAARRQAEAQGVSVAKAAPKKTASKKLSPKKATKKPAAAKSTKKAAVKPAAGKVSVAKKATKSGKKAVSKKAASKKAASKKSSPKKGKFKRVTAIYVKANKRGGRHSKKYRANLSYEQLVEYERAKAAKSAGPSASASASSAAEIKGLAAYRIKQKAVSEKVKAARAETEAAKQTKKAAQEALKATRAQYKGKRDKASRAAVLAAEAAFEAEEAKLKAAVGLADAKIKAAKAELVAGKPKKAKKGKARVVSPRVYGGQYKTKRVRIGKKGMQSQVVRIGDRSYRTYMAVSKKGKARKIPSWMIAGAKSAKAYKEKPELAQKLAERRAKAAAAVSKKIQAGTYPFTPNLKRVVSFKEWAKTMKKNKSRRSKSRKKHYGKARHNPLMQAAANKRGSASRRKGRKGSKRARRNPELATYISNPGLAVDTIVSVLKDSALVGGGLLTHKALTNLVSQKIEFFSTNKYGKSIAAAAVAAVGIPAASLLGKPGEKLAVGMGAALIHTVLTNVLVAADQPEAVAYLGDYTEADMKLPAGGYGSYYEFSPGQVYSGMGEYIQQTGPLAGFGEPMLAQAAAGLGESPLLAQAAAGVGEYIVTGAEGIGEYEQVTPEYTQPSVVREGISPSLGAAEQALSIAEAAAGVGGLGNVDLALEQIVYPTGQALDITDAPGGSRAGVFYGGNGVFGP